jgi:hypothetical protein
LNIRVLFVFFLLLQIQSKITIGHSNEGKINLQSPEDEITAVLYNSNIEVNMSKALHNLMKGVPVVFYGNNLSKINEFYLPTFAIVNRTMAESSLVASGLWLQKEGNTTIEHQVQVYDSSFTQNDLDSIYRWLGELSPVITPSGYRIEALIEQIDHHEPYGVLKTETEILRILEDNSESDWYDISVTQKLTPGINLTSSSWEWNWLQYIMNGSLGTSNVYLSDYDPPPNKETLGGPFSFLWRILGFDIRDFIPWLHPPESKIVSLDKSDFSVELFIVRFEAPRDYSYSDEPFEIRHHYVLRVNECEDPMFWHQSQAQYAQSESFPQIPYITPPLASGYVVKQSKREEA